PDRIFAGGELRLDLPRLPTAGGNHENLVSACRFRRQAGRPHPVGDPFSVRRITRPAAFRRDQAGLAARRRNHIDTASVPLGAEDDGPAVWGEVWLLIVGRIVGKAQGLAAVGGLRPNIEVAAIAAVGGIRDPRSIGCERRVAVETAVVGDLAQMRAENLFLRRPRAPREETGGD